MIDYTCPQAIRLLVAKLCVRKIPNLAIFSDQLSQIPEAQLDRVVLFVAAAPYPHSRESRLALVAKHAGWFPILVYRGQEEHIETNLFFLHFRFQNPIELQLASWLYKGSLIHLFARNGDEAYPLVRLKNKKIILDIYDTCTGSGVFTIRAIKNEKAAIKMTDGLIHRDKRLQLLHGKGLCMKGKSSAFVPDPLPEIREILPKSRSDEIHVVSGGYVDEKENSILRIAQVLCEAKIHVHIYFNPCQLSVLHSLSSYFELQKRSNYFHIEKPIYGAEFRRRLAIYDFGLAVFEPDLFQETFKAYHRDYLRGCGSSRLADYIYAGIGVIVSPLLEFQNELAHQYAPMCVEATKDFLGHPRKILEDAMMRKKEIPPQKMEELTARGMANRLDALYSKLL